MAKKGGQPGNNNNQRGKLWNDALRKAIIQEDGRRLRAAAEQLLTQASEGAPWAIRELADRLDGKAFQSVELTGDPDNPIAVTEIVRKIVQPRD